MLRREEELLIWAFEEAFHIELELIGEREYGCEDHGFTLTFQIDENVTSEIEFYWEEDKYFLFFRDFGEIYMEFDGINEVICFFIDYVQNYGNWEAIFGSLNQECAAQEMVPFGQNIDPMTYN